MPLVEIPPNAGSKRGHEEFVTEMTQSKLSFAAALPTDITPCQTMPPADIPSSPLTDRSRTPTPPPTTSGEPPAKRKCIAPTDKAKAKEQAKATKQAEKAKADEDKKAKLAEKAKADEEKKAKAEKEREKKRQEKEQKQQEKEQKLQEKERKQLEKDEEQRKVQEAKEKKERSQLKLASFFKTGVSTPSKAIANAQPKDEGNAPVTSRAGPDDVSEYSKVFQPFFIKEYVRLAKNAFECDEPALSAKASELDAHLRGDKVFQPRPFTGLDSVDYFCLPSLPPPRGRPYPSVRKIISIMSDASTMAGTSIEDSSVHSARQLLREVPIKYVSFFQDVRPAYCGTVTALPPAANESTTLHASRLRKLARRPVSREVLPLHYDYDSEAEWVDDGDGEDIDGDDDDDDDDEDDDEDMTDFLDNSEDVIKRPVFASGMEPECSGLCFEEPGSRPPSDLAKYRMEFILDIKHQSIDPFSSQYWQPEPKVTSIALHPPASTNAFAAISGGKKTLVPANLVKDLKLAILKYPKLSKIGLVEVLSTQFEKCTKAQIKNSVETLAERQDKMWRLKAQHGL